jgi:uncharacterized protein (DUF58 family)
VIGSSLTPAAATGNAHADGRAAFSVTPRALFLLCFGLIWIGPAWVDRRAAIVLLAWNVLIVALCWLNLRRLPAPGSLRITRTWRTSLTIGVDAVVDIEVANRGATRIAMYVTDYVSSELRSDLPELALDVPPGQTTGASYRVSPRARGDSTMGPVALQWRDAWGLIERRAIAIDGQQVRVYPTLREGREQSTYLVRSRQVTLEKRRARRVGAGREFESLRDYRPGDEQRDVCWSASAKRGKLVTKVYQPERSQTVWIMVDAGRLLRARLAKQTLLDATVSAALTIAQVALASGDRVGLVAYGRRLQHRVAPSRGATHLRLLVEALAGVRADGVEGNHAGAAAAVTAAQKRRALIVWLTEIADTAGIPDVVEHASRLTPRHVLLFGVLRQPEIAALTAATPQTPRDMYRLMSARETLDRRESLLHRLRLRGALVLETSPEEVSAALVDRYLEVKERGLL